MTAVAGCWLRRSARAERLLVRTDPRPGASPRLFAMRPLSGRDGARNQIAAGIMVYGELYGRVSTIASIARRAGGDSRRLAVCVVRGGRRILRVGRRERRH